MIVLFSASVRLANQVLRISAQPARYVRAVEAPRISFAQPSPKHPSRLSPEGDFGPTRIAIAFPYWAA